MKTQTGFQGNHALAAKRHTTAEANFPFIGNFENVSLHALKASIPTTPSSQILTNNYAALQSATKMCSLWRETVWWFYTHLWPLHSSCLNMELLLNQNHNRERFATGIATRTGYPRDQSLNAAKNLYNFKLLHKVYGHGSCFYIFN